MTVDEMEKKVKTKKKYFDDNLLVSTDLWLIAAREGAKILATLRSLKVGNQKPTTC